MEDLCAGSQEVLTSCNHMCVCAPSCKVRKSALARNVDLACKPYPSFLTSWRLWPIISSLADSEEETAAAPPQQQAKGFALHSLHRERGA